MALHSVGLNPASLAYYDDGDPRIRLGTWFYSSGAAGKGWKCAGARVWLPAAVPAGRTLKAYALLWHDPVNLPSPGTIELSLFTRTASIVTDGVEGWHDVMWSSGFAFADWPTELLFIFYEFVGAGSGDYLYSGSDNVPGSSIQSSTLPGLYCVGPGEINSSARSWFSQSPADVSATNPATNGFSVWYGSDIIVDDNATPVPTGSATLDYTFDVIAAGETPVLPIPQGSASLSYRYDMLAAGDAPILDIPEGAALLSYAYNLTAKGITPDDIEPLVTSAFHLQISSFARDYIRQRATDLMNCRVLITRPETQYDPTTRRDVSIEGRTLYEGPARIWEVPSGQNIIIGEEEVTVTSTYLSLPYWVYPLPEDDDLITVIDSDDPDLTGRTLNIESTVRGGGLRASRRFQVTVSTSKKTSW